MKIGSAIRVAACLAGLVALCLPAVLPRLGVPDVRYHMEALTFVTSQETWLRQQHGEADAWQRPTWNGALRVNKPPLTVWVNLLAWTGLRESDGIGVLALRARLAGVAMFVLMLASTFWLGWQLGGRRLAAGSLLATGSMFFLIHQARLATYDTHLAGWVALAMAAGFWSLRAPPEKGLCLRLAALLSALALGAAILTKGPIALILVSVPLAAGAFLVPAVPRRDGLRRWLFITLAGVALALPWYIHLLRQLPESIDILAGEYRAKRRIFQVPWYYLNSIGLVFPWSIWFAAGIVHGLRTWRKERDPALALPLVWFLAVFVLLSIPGAKRQRYIVPALPAAGLVIAWVWFCGPAWGRRLRAWLLSVHWGVLGVLAAALGLFVLSQPALVRTGLLTQPELPVESPAWGLAAAVGLVALAAAGARAHMRDRAAAAFLCTFLWIAGITGYYNFQYAVSPDSRYAQLEDCRRVHATAGEKPLFYLAGIAELPWQPDAKFLIYTRRIVLPLEARDLKARCRQGGEFFLIAQDTPEERAVVDAAGLALLFPYDDGDSAKRLYRCKSPGDGRPR